VISIPHLIICSLAHSPTNPRFWKLRIFRHFPRNRYFRNSDSSSYCIVSKFAKIFNGLLLIIFFSNADYSLFYLSNL
jgi:hypothetical protein